MWNKLRSKQRCTTIHHSFNKEAKKRRQVIETDLFNSCIKTLEVLLLAMATEKPNKRLLFLTFDISVSCFKTFEVPLLAVAMEKPASGSNRVELTKNILILSLIYSVVLYFFSIQMNHTIWKDSYSLHWYKCFLAVIGQEK